MALLSKVKIRSALMDLNKWTVRGKEIRRNYVFDDFVNAMGFVNSVAMYAERLNHHPDIIIKWNKVTLSLSTHSEGGITGKDILLAKKIDLLTAEFPGQNDIRLVKQK